jgi:hypothetical protein
MKEDLRMLIKQYRKELVALESRYLEEKSAGRTENESYFFGQWCKLGSVVCDLKALQRKYASKGDLVNRIIS